METGEILTSLAKLEASLKEIDSAKEQVNQTVGAYSTVQKQINEYTKTLDTIAGSIKAIITDMKSQRAALSVEADKLSTVFKEEAAEIVSKQGISLSEILDSLKASLCTANATFLSSCEGSAKAFRQNIDTEIEKLDDNVEALKTCSHNLNSLHEDVKTSLESINEVKQNVLGVEREIVAFKSSQNVELEKIKTDIEECFSKYSQSLRSISNDLIETQNAQDKEIASITAAISSIYSKIDSMEKKMTNSHTTLIILTIINFLTIMGVAAINLFRITYKTILTHL